MRKSNLETSNAVDFIANTQTITKKKSNGHLDPVTSKLEAAHVLACTGSPRRQLVPLTTHYYFSNVVYMKVIVASGRTSTLSASSAVGISLSEPSGISMAMATAMSDSLRADDVSTASD